jgi:hypothetical protein
MNFTLKKYLPYFILKILFFGQFATLTECSNQHTCLQKEKNVKQTGLIQVNKLKKVQEKNWFTTHNPQPPISVFWGSLSSG